MVWGRCGKYYFILKPTVRLAVTAFVEKNSEAASDLAARSGTINEGYLPNCGREGICHLWGEMVSHIPLI